MSKLVTVVLFYCDLSVRAADGKIMHILPDYSTHANHCIVPKRLSKCSP